MIDILRQKPLFPLQNFEDVEKIFEFNLDPENGEPNLALLSIVAGLIEHSLVTITDKDDLAANSRPVCDRKDLAQRKFLPNCKQNPSFSPHNHNLSAISNNHHLPSLQRSLSSDPDFNDPDYVSSGDSESSRSSSPERTANDNLNIPKIEFKVVETLYKRFVDQFKNSIDFKEEEQLKTNLKIKKISDSVWEHLSNSYYKDKAHLQSIFSYLTTSKLDCFGLAFAVIAGCQILNLKDIYLALSEDHAWVMFDLLPGDLKAQKDGEIKEYLENNSPVPTCALHGTCEVTWHGKANSDKRGQPVTYKNSWLYTNGYAVRCDIRMCVVALVNSINPLINTNTDSETLALLQQRLLWLLFRKENYFPMSLGNLGELENLCPTPDAPLTAHELFNLGIEISRKEYNDSHVYPYSYLASYFFKHGRFKEALETWADSSAVMAKYNYSRDDEEIYKEFFEVANELVPSMLKVLSAGGLEPGRGSQRPFLQDPECLALILKFYDNICCWEEGSSTPVLHIGWAKNFVATTLKFSYVIRSKIKLATLDEWNQNKEGANKQDADSKHSQSDQCTSTAGEESQQAIDTKEGMDLHNPDKIKNGADGLSEDSRSSCSIGELKAAEDLVGEPPMKRSHSSDDNDSDCCAAGKIKFEPGECSSDSSPGCCTMAKIKSRYSPREARLVVNNDNNVTVILKSRKIAGVRDLLQAERLNKTAIELQLTAQSQTVVRGRSNSSSYSSEFISSALSTIGGSTRSKRLHR